MENLKIEGTKYTFDVDFNAETGILQMGGASYPENAIDFFGPIYEWLRMYIKQIGNPIQLNLRINYLNTSSSKCILDFLEILEDFHLNGGQAKVNWYYEADDEDIMETGEDICDDLELSYQLIPY